MNETISLKITSLTEEQISEQIDILKKLEIETKRDASLSFQERKKKLNKIEYSRIRFRIETIRRQKRNREEAATKTEQALEAHKLEFKNVSMAHNGRITNYKNSIEEDNKAINDLINRAAILYPSTK